jgi:hypothetical protein
VTLQYDLLATLVKSENIITRQTWVASWEGVRAVYR